MFRRHRQSSDFEFHQHPRKIENEDHQQHDQHHHHHHHHHAPSSDLSSFFNNSNSRIISSSPSSSSSSSPPSPCVTPQSVSRAIASGSIHPDEECEADQDLYDETYRWQTPHSNHDDRYYPLLNYSHLPNWLKDNKHIFTGYRLNLGWRRSCDSACHMHNETLNVWTHFLAFLVMTMLLFLTLWTTSPHGVDRLNIGVLVSNHSTTQSSSSSSSSSSSPSPSSTSSQSVCPNTKSFEMMSIFTHQNSDVEYWPSTRSPFCPSSSTTTSSSSSFSSISPPPSSSSTPAELLKLLSSESLHSVVQRVGARLPSMEQVTSVLREKAHSLGSLVDKAGPAWPSIEQTKNQLIEYVESVEIKIEKLKQAMSEFKDSSMALHINTENMDKTLGEAKRKLIEQLEGISSSFMDSPNVDLLSSAKTLLNDFYNKLDTFPPTKKSSASNVNHDNENSGAAGTDSTSSESEVSSSSHPPHPHVHVRIIPFATSSDRALFVSHKGINNTVADVDDDIHTDTEEERSLGEKFFESFLISDSGLHAYLPRWPLAIFLLTAMCCLGFSAFFHLFQAVSRSIAVNLQCLDYAGICLLITGSNVPIIYYGFYCLPNFQFLYIFIVSVLGLTGFTVSVLPRFRPLKYRTMKVLVFVSMGGYGVIPMLHLAIYFGRHHFIFNYLIGMGVLYLVGAAIYLFQIPERFYPGAFDYWFHSHQLWHCSIFIAVLTLYFGLVRFYEWRMQQVCTL